MATSPIYNWPEPDNTDLVKNGALAIRTLGNAIDTTMATMVPKSIVDAKGDLIAGTAADTTSRLAVGNNGETLVADSFTATGLRYQTGVNTNTVINGGMDIWQRGTSGTFTGTVVYPAADRWAAVSTGTSATCTMSRQTADTTSQTYGLRFGRNSGQTNTGAPYIATAIESQQSRLYAGQTVTLSFYAKAGANAPLTLTTLLRTGTGTDQTVAAMFSTGWTGGVNVDTNHTVTTTMARYSVTTTLGSTVNEIFIGFGYAPTGTAGANEWFQIEGVQLELGSVPTTFKRAGGTLQGELAACQRYYYRFGGLGVYQSFGLGYAKGATLVQFPVPNPVTMRAIPTSIDFSTLICFDGTGFTGAVSALVFDGAFPNISRLQATVTGATTYRPYELLANNSLSGYVGINAEL